MNEKLFDIIELKFMNDSGQMFCGENSNDELFLMNNYLSKMSKKEKDMFFAAFLKTVVLKNDFFEKGFDFEDLVEIVNWIGYNFYS